MSTPPHDAAQQLAIRGRYAEIAMLYTGGCTLQEVGDAIGMSRERVRQIVNLAGITERHCGRADCGPLLRAYSRDKTLQQIADECGATKSYVQATLSTLELPTKSRKFWTRELIIARLQKLASELGRQPTATDVQHGRPGKRGYPSQITVSQNFGSWNKAIRAAGFTPLESGHKLSERSTPRQKEKGNHADDSNS